VVAAGDEISLAPGEYVENNALPNVDNLTIRGSGKNATILRAVGGSITPTLSWAPVGGTYEALTLVDLTITNLNNNQLCVSLDGTSTAVAGFAQFMRRACIFDGVVLDKGASTGDAYEFIATDKVYISDGNGSTITNNVAGWNGSGRWQNTGYVLVSGTILGNGTTGFTLTYDDTVGVVRPYGGRQGFYLVNGSSMYGTVTLTKAAYFVCGPDSAIYGDVIATALALFTAPAHAPFLRIAGQIGAPSVPSAITVTAPAITAAAVAASAIPVVDLSGATIWSSPTKAVKLSGTAGGVIRFAPFAHGAHFENALPVSANNVQAGAETDFDIRTSFHQQDALGAIPATNGTIDRDKHSFGTVAAPGSQTFPTPFPSTATLTPVVTSQTSGVNVQATVSPTTLTMVGGTTSVSAMVLRN
jgi:hypothetical protein